MSVQLARRLFSVDDYYRMAEAGILNEDDRVELIEGEIIQMPPIGSLHASTVDSLTALLVPMVASKSANLRVQGPLRLDERSEPVPDIMLLRYRADFYRSSHPGPPDVVLLIEVVDTTLDYDREVKLPLYAQAGVSEVWIVDIGAGVIEGYWQPSLDGYRSAANARRGDTVSPAALPELRLQVNDILG